MTNTTAYIKTPKGGCIEIEVENMKLSYDNVALVTPAGRVYMTHLSNVLVVEEPASAETNHD